MDAKSFEQLLYEEESTTLDFKLEQYPFAKATDDQKSELLKDVLGFANAWRRSVAYILIGVQDVRGGRIQLVGISAHLDDHSVQQFVNNLTNRPVRFHYSAFNVESKQVGIFTIDPQPRPLYLKKDYGKLRKNEVYVRRGSSTDPTKPASIDEIAMMGSGDNMVADLTGLTAEIEWNRKLLSMIDEQFKSYIQVYGIGNNVSKPNPVSSQRLRLQAIQTYLKSPSLPIDVPVVEVEAYWERAALCNGLMDKVMGLTTVAVVDGVVESILKMKPDLLALGTSLIGRIGKLSR